MKRIAATLVAVMVFSSVAFGQGEPEARAAKESANTAFLAAGAASTSAANRWSEDCEWQTNVIGLYADLYDYLSPAQRSSVEAALEDADTELDAASADIVTANSRLLDANDALTAAEDAYRVGNWAGCVNLSSASQTSSSQAQDKVSDANGHLSWAEGDLEYAEWIMGY